MKTAIIIGASSGMGNEIAKRLIAAGWQVALAARREDKLEMLAKEATEGSFAVKLDINAENAVEILDGMFQRLGHVDLYFHVSGIGKTNPRLDNAEVEEATVRTNAMGFARMVGEAYRLLVRQGGGHIAVISSIAGVRGLGAAPSYSATKAFQHTYIQALEQQANVNKTGVRFTEIRPGFVDTPLLAGDHFPLTMPVVPTVDHIMKAVTHRRHVTIIDWRYRILVARWRMVPTGLWRRMNIGIKRS
ncbi:MAG: SDR family NAD(P)-dependent oxidoreductase [Prevotella sp.]|jgi:NADP-dependent 3-hydroxy acid dehydrogenase YdfG